LVELGNDRRDLAPVGCVRLVFLRGLTISVIALDAVSIDERYGALCWLAPRDVKKAAKLLGAV
jgi:hypothetical protein